MRQVLFIATVLIIIGICFAQDLTNLTKELENQEQKINSTAAQVKQAKASIEEQIEKEKQRILNLTNQTILVNAAQAQLNDALQAQQALVNDQKQSLNNALLYMSQQVEGIAVDSKTLTATQMNDQLSKMDAKLLQELQATVAKANTVNAQVKAMEAQIAIDQARFARLESLLKQLREKVVALKIK